MLRVVFFGTPKIAVNSLEYLFNSKEIEVVAVVTQEDKPSGRGHKLCAPPIKEKAQELGIKVLQPKSIRKEPEVMQALEDLKPDFFVTFAFGQILSQEVLDIPKYATINLHASLLPKYRGANPIQRCIYNGDSITGVTTMITVLELDAGDICQTKEIEITEGMTDVELATIISEISPSLLEETLLKLSTGALIPKKQDETKVTFANKFSKQDGLIDFNQHAKNIEYQVRAMYSWPNAYTYYNNKILKIMEAQAISYDCCEENGIVVSVAKEGIEICAGKDKLLVKKVKPEGKGLMDAYAWANGSGIKAGDKLGA